MRSVSAAGRRGGVDADEFFDQFPMNRTVVVRIFRQFLQDPGRSRFPLREVGFRKVAPFQQFRAPLPERR